MSSNAVPPPPSFRDGSLPHFVVPEVRIVGFDAPLRWLKLGWADTWRMPLGSLGYGSLLALGGLLILALTARLPYLFTAAISGFLLVAPMLGAGLYEKSRRYLAGETAPLVATALAWRRNPSALLGFSLLSLLAGTAWQIVSVVLIALFYKGTAMTPMNMMIEVVLNPQYTLLFAVYLIFGGVLAALVFAASVVSVPMLVDRPCDLLSALTTSFNAVSANPGPLAFWAMIIMVMTGLGFVTALLGLVLVLPWLAHASFHAYRELVE